MIFSIVQSPSGEAYSSWDFQKCPLLHGLWGPLPCTQKSTTGPYPEADKSNMHKYFCNGMKYDEQNLKTEFIACQCTQSDINFNPTSVLIHKVAKAITIFGYNDVRMVKISSR